MTISVQINPNLRVEGGCTIADLDDDVHGGPTEALVRGAEVTVYEPISGLAGPGWLLEVDTEDRTVLIQVDWAQLRISATAATFGGAFVLQPNIPALALAAHVA